MTQSEGLISRYQYGAQYIPDYTSFKEAIFNKSIIPYQVEFQPPPAGKKICWLECPYCYGASATDTGERLSKERALEIMRQIAAGGVKKIIFAGYATDPLNSPYIEDLLEIAIDSKMIFGFNTKALRVSERLIALLSRPDIMPTSYLSLSVDAGNNEVYRDIHDVKSQAKLYDKVLENTRAIAGARIQGDFKFDLSAAYLVNDMSYCVDSIESFIQNFQSAGCNLLRFAFPQPPRETFTDEGIVPSQAKCNQYKEIIQPILKNFEKPDCPILIVDADSDHQIFQKARTTPCFARFVYPTVGFDGWLYHCSQSSAPNFREMALGNLNEEDFWTLFYNYQIDNTEGYFSSCTQLMNKLGCRCDRKEHLVNLGVKQSGVFHSDLQ